MMLRDVLDEIVRRNLWPIPVVAVAVAAAGPLLFLKSAPPEASPSAAVVSPAQSDLPARAQALLTATDGTAAARRRLSRSPRDPFRAPKKATKSTHAGAKKSSSQTKQAQTASSSGSKLSGPVPVIILTPKGKTSGTSAPASTPSGGDSGTSTRRSGDSSSTPTVDMRFGAKKDSPIQRQIPRLKTFEVGGKTAVVFVKYSTSSHKAVFAIDPSTTVRGDIECRRVDGLCRYVDIPAGRYVRLTFVNDDGSRVSRRLDVVRVHGDA